MSNNSTVLLKSPSNQITFRFVHIIILHCLGIITIAANLLVIIIYALSEEKIRKKTANMLLCNQAVVDLFQGTITNGVTLFGQSFGLAKEIIYQFSMALSLHTVILVSLERYIFIIKPLFHRKFMTRRRICYAVVITWLSSILWIPFRLVHLIDKNVNWKHYTLYYISISEAIVFIIIIAVIYSYVATYRTVKKFLTRKYHYSREGRNIASVGGQMNYNYNEKEMKITQIFISMFVAFLVSYLPVFINGIIHISLGSENYTPLLLKIMSLDLTFYLLNCIFNPIVTIIYKEDFKKRFGNIFLRCKSMLFPVRNNSEIGWTIELNEFS